jgi:hypothetical protein
MEEAKSIFSKSSVGEMLLMEIAAQFKILFFLATGCSIAISLCLALLASSSLRLQLAAPMEFPLRPLAS